MIVISRNPEETFAIGEKLGKQLKVQSVVCFFGDLAAGKTTFIKGFVSGATEISSDKVSSPTFVFLNIYEGKKTVYHFDLYRLKNAEGFFSLGFEEYWEAQGICCIEWAERIEKFLPPNCIRIRMKAIGEGTREIILEGIDDLEEI